MLVYIKIGDRSQNRQIKTTTKCTMYTVLFNVEMVPGIAAMVPLKDNITFTLFLLATLEHKERPLKHSNLYELPHVAQLTCTLHASWMRMICLWAVLYLRIYMHTGTKFLVGKTFMNLAKQTSSANIVSSQIPDLAN